MIQRSFKRLSINNPQKFSLTLNHANYPIYTAKMIEQLTGYLITKEDEAQQAKIKCITIFSNSEISFNV